MGEKGTRGAAYLEDYLYQKYLPDKGFKRNISDHGSAFNEKTGQNAVYDQDKQQWIDAKTGQALSPSGTEPIREK